MGSDNPAISYVERRARPLFLLTSDGLPMRGEREMIEPVRAFLSDLDRASTPERLDAALDRHGADAVADRSLAAIRIRPAEFGGMEASGQPVTNIRDSRGTILHWAARSGDRAEWAIPAVLARGADPDLADENGNTPLMEAIRARSGPAVKALLEAGAEPLLCCPVGGSVMHSAAHFGAVECLRELAAGLDERTMDALLSVRDANGRLPEDAARTAPAMDAIVALRDESEVRAEIAAAERAAATRALRAPATRSSMAAAEPSPRAARRL